MDGETSYGQQNNIQKNYNTGVNPEASERQVILPPLVAHIVLLLLISVIV